MFFLFQDKTLQHICVHTYIHCWNLKGTHARDFHNVFLNFFYIFQLLIDTKSSTANIFEHILKIRPDIQSFRSLAVFAESAKHGWVLSPKRGVEFSAVFATVRFWIVLSVFGENAESNFAFRCRRKCRVKLCTFGNIQHIQRRSEIMRFRRIRGVKRSVFAENAEWNGAFSAITLYSRKSGYELGFNTYLKKKI
jgi:hypothetical protein